MKFSFAKTQLPKTGVIVVGVYARRELSPTGIKLDSLLDRGITRAMRASRFMGNKGQLLSIITPSSSRLDRLILIGLGKAKHISELEMQKIGG